MTFVFVSQRNKPDKQRWNEGRREVPHKMRPNSTQSIPRLFGWRLGERFVAECCGLEAAMLEWVPPWQRGRWSLLLWRCVVYL